MSPSSEEYNNHNSKKNTIHVAARALDRLRFQLENRKSAIENMKMNIEILSNEIAEIEESCQIISNYINAVYCNYELYDFSRSKK